MLARSASLVAASSSAHRSNAQHRNAPIRQWQHPKRVLDHAGEEKMTLVVMPKMAGFVAQHGRQLVIGERADQPVRDHHLAGPTSDAVAKIRRLGRTTRSWPSAGRCR